MKSWKGGLADNAAVMWWQGKAKQQEQIAHVIEAAKAGHEIVAASNENLYFDFYQSKDKANEPLAYGGFLPLETVYAFNPKDKFKGHADAANMIIGVQAQLWAEYMPNLAQVEYMAYPRSCALAELAWLPAGQKNYDSFKSRLQTHTKRLEQLGVNFRKGK